MFFFNEPIYRFIFFVYHKKLYICSMKQIEEYKPSLEYKNGSLVFHNKNVYIVMDRENKPIYIRQPNPPVRLENNEKIKIQ